MAELSKNAFRILLFLTEVNFSFSYSFFQVLFSNIIQATLNQYTASIVLAYLNQSQTISFLLDLAVKALI